MSTYKGIKGFKVQSFAADPVPSIVAWASGTDLPAARNEARGTGSSLTSGIVFGGTLPPGKTGTTFQYDGSSWTSKPSMSSARGLFAEASAGTITAALAFGGEPQTGATEEYDGSSWTGGGTMNTARYTLGGAGTQTAAIGAGGYINSGGVQTACEEYDGSSWTSVTGLPSAANALSGCGPQTAALMGGNSFNEYDGTNWTAAGTPANPAGYKSVGGIQTNAVTVGGNPPSSAPTTETYNGTSFSTSSATLNTGRYTMAAWGTASHFGVAGGTEPSRSNKTEELSNFQEPNSFEIIGDAFYNTTEKKFKFVGEGAQSWATGGSLSDARYGFWASFGLQTAAVACGGSDSPNEFFATTEEYNGTSWGSGGNIPTALSGGGSLGTLTAGFGAGAYRFSPAARISDSYEYDGSSWTSGGSLSTQRISSMGFGTQTAGAISGGSNPSNSVVGNTEEYDGSSFSSGGTLATAVSRGGTAGTQTAGIVFGGSTGSATGVTQTYDGSSFSTNPATMNVARTSIKSGLNGSQTSTVAFGGSPPQTNATEDWDGTTWTTSTALPATVQSHGGAGTGASALSFGGTSPDRADTYEYTFAGTASIKTVTTS